MFSCRAGRCVGSLTFSSPKTYIAHLQYFHPSLVQSGPLLCTHSDCDKREFGKFNSFRKHVMKHPENNVQCSPYADGALNEECDEDKDEDMVTEQRQPTGHENCSNGSDVHIAFEKSSLKFDEALANAIVTHIAHLYSSALTETQVQSIIDSHINLLNGVFLSILKDSVMSIFSRPKVACEISDTEVKNMSRMFDSLMNMFDGFQTSYLRLKEYENCGAFIKPEEFVTGSALNEVNVSGQVVLEPVDLKGQFIPFRKVLKGCLELPGIFKSIMAYVEKLDANVNCGMENIIQGKLWQEKIKPTFVGKIVLPVTFFFDDYETNKELGCHTGVHSLGAGYLRLPCLPPQFQGMLENIFLVLLFHSSDKDFSNDNFFRKVVDEFLLLEKEGVSVVTSEGIYLVYFALCFVGGDNKGANEILGYVKGFTANYYCRLCSSRKEVMATQTKIDPSKARTPTNYNRELRVNNYSLTGRRGECVFNDLRSYHVYENFHDVMHDWDEGIWKYVMTDIVRYFVSNSVCTVERLNELIQTFYYGPNEERNKPSLILSDHLKTDHNLRMSASEMRCFVRYFGLIVGHIVHQDDVHLMKVWKWYLMTRQIADTITAPRVYESDSNVLSGLMQKHHSLYMKLFKKNLKPQFYISLHDPDIQLALEPLDQLSCIRIEAKHKEGTGAASKSHNRVNLPHTVATHHQRMFALRLLAGRGLVPKFECSKVQVTPIFSIQDYLSFSDILPPDSENFDSVKWVKTNGMKYDENSIVLISVNEDVPLFGRIHVISLKAQNELFFVLQCLTTVCFDSHVHAYEIEYCHNWKFIQLKDLQTHVVSSVRLSPNGKKYVPFRFSVTHC